MKTLTNILKELVLIRKELQAIRNIVEFSHKITVEGKDKEKQSELSIRDIPKPDFRL